MKRIIDEKTVNPVMEGQAASKRQTAYELAELKKQSMMKMGIPLAGVMELEYQLNELRLYNVLENWTKVEDTTVDTVKNALVKLYKTVTLDTEFENGQKGIERIEFTTEPDKLNRTSEQIMGLEDMHEAETGMPTRVFYINPELLRSIKYNWFITIVPTEMETTELRRVLFFDSIQQMASIFGLQSMNMEHLKERAASLIKEDPNKLFLRQPMMPQVPQGGGVEFAGRNNQLNKQIAQGAGQVQSPSLNTLSQSLS